MDGYSALALFQYWKNPGPFNGAGLEPKHIGLDRFLGILSVLVQAAFSFQGMELVAMYVLRCVKPELRNLTLTMPQCGV